MMLRTLMSFHWRHSASLAQARPRRPQAPPAGSTIDMIQRSPDSRRPPRTRAETPCPFVIEATGLLDRYNKAAELMNAAARSLPVPPGRIHHFRWLDDSPTITFWTLARVYRGCSGETPMGTLVTLRVSPECDGWRGDSLRLREGEIPPGRRKGSSCPGDRSASWRTRTIISFSLIYTRQCDLPGKAFGRTASSDRKPDLGENAARPGRKSRRVRGNERVINASLRAIISHLV